MLQQNIINGIVLVAGLSSRMNDFKPLMSIGNKTIIESTIDNMIFAGIEQIVVVLGFRGEDIQKALSSSKERLAKLKFIYNENYKTTQMLDSIKIGLNILSPCDWFFVTPADMLAISSNTYEILIKHSYKYQGKVIFPLLNGYKKHPPLISHKCKDEIINFNGFGLREIWQQYENDILEIKVDDYGCSLDIDYSSDYEKVYRYIHNIY